MNPEIKKVCNGINNICYKMAPELKNKTGGWVLKDDGSGQYRRVDGPGKWVLKHDGSRQYQWIPNKNDS